MNGTSHAVRADEVMALVDGELRGERAAQVERHAAECAECGETRRKLEETARSMKQWKVEEPATSFEEALRRVEKRGEEKAGAKAFWFWRLTPIGRVGVMGSVVAASLAIVLVFGMQVREERLTGYMKARSEGSKTVRGVPGDQVSALQQSMAGMAGNRESRGLAGPLPPPPPPVPAGSSTQPLDGKSLTQFIKIQKGLMVPAFAPMIARTATLTVVVKDFGGARAEMEKMLARRRGYTAELTTSSEPDQAKTLRATLKIPAEQLAGVLAELKGMGRVEQETQQGEEVTQEHADLEARLKNSRETEVRLRNILETRTGKMEDVLEVEQEIARVRGEIERMEAEEEALKQRVVFATVTLEMREEYRAAFQTQDDTFGGRMRNALVGAFRGVRETVVEILLMVVRYGPGFVIWVGMLWWPARKVWRRMKMVAEGV